jgi:hypothetical protein
MCTLPENLVRDSVERSVKTSATEQDRLRAAGGAITGGTGANGRRRSA